MPRFAARGPVLVWVRSPFFIGYFFVVVFAYPWGVFLPGQTDVLSRLRSTSSLAIVFSTSPFLCTCSAGTLSSGAFGRVSRARLQSFAWSLHFSPALSTESTRQDYHYRGGRTWFPAVITYILEVLHIKVNSFIAYVAVDPN